MFAGLADEIRTLAIPAEESSIEAAISLYDQLGARIAEAVGALAATSAWFADGSTSVTAWLRNHGRMTRRAAQRLSSHASRLRRLPVCAAAYADGELSAGQIETIMTVLDDELVDVFAAQEAELVPYLAPLTVAGVARAMAAWKQRAQPEPTMATEPDRSLYLSQTIDDRYVLDGVLDGEGGAVVAAALRLATPGPDGRRTPAERRADGMVEICRFFLDHQQSHPGGRHRPHLNVVVEWDDLVAQRGGRVVDGPFLDGPTVSKLLCDSAVHRVVTSGRSSILDYGTSTRTIAAPLWNALVIRDEHCRFPGCDRPSTWCEGHHLVWVTHDGPTELNNLVLVCSRHHHLLHQPGWHAKLRPDGDLDVTDPYGEIRTTSPPRADKLRC